MVESQALQRCRDSADKRDDLNSIFDGIDQLVNRGWQRNIIDGRYLPRMGVVRAGGLHLEASVFSMASVPL
eukprot:4217437-Prymnesium_polylepis.3